ncbi:uncharacterized protein LOC120349652 [Nilaparvata lugens]|uniref:uncharacterized protein LOC120349652 n=1 Tax=Nilaparvata lugens TaxID=108931 RepID=UPI00193DFC8E|nr:uncharacterized protein LOC120349652 [Nilaparvata lugens]
MIDLMGFSNVSIFQRFPSINVMMQSKGKGCVSIALILTLTITTALQRDAKNVISDITLFYMIPLLAIQELKSPISWKPSGSWKKSLQLFLSLLSVLGLKTCMSLGRNREAKKERKHHCFQIYVGVRTYAHEEFDLWLCKVMFLLS